MDRDVLPLLFAADWAAPAQTIQPLDRLRMQKGVFLLQEKGPNAWRVFKFHPYDWGPYSRELAGELDELLSKGALEEKQPGARYGSYRTASRVRERLRQYWDALSPAEQTLIKQVRRFVQTTSFSALLKEIYSAYPEYATRSRFTG